MKVFAVDPESQGMSASIKDLSQDEMQIVNLWVLSITTTGFDNKTPAVLAQRLPERTNASEPVVAQTRDTVGAKPVQLARVETDKQESRVWDPVPTKRRSAPVIGRLPKTASLLPLISLIGLASFAGATIVNLSPTSSSKS